MPSASGGRVGSPGVRMIAIGVSDQGSSAASGTIPGLSVGLVPWLNQSRIMNCNQAVTSEFTVVAGMSSVRVSSWRLTSRGLGVSTSSSVASTIFASGMFLPKRDPARPIAGEAGSL